MTFSLNEIESMGKRAARGAGLDWGIAEEAGKAVRWLSAMGLPGPTLLARLLTQNEGRAYDTIAPMSVDGVWEAKSGRLCPLIAGAVLTDRAEWVGQGDGLKLGATAFPLLLAPYVACCAGFLDAAIMLYWSGVRLSISPDGGLAVDGDMSDVTAPATDHVQCRVVESGAGIPSVNAPEMSVDADAWRCLSALAHRTYAPATEASRTLGAGSGLVDND